MKRTHLHLTPAAEARISAIVASSGLKRAEVIRRLIDEALDARERRAKED